MTDVARYDDPDVIDIRTRAGIKRPVPAKSFRYVVYNIQTGRVEQHTWNNQPSYPGTIKDRLGFLEMINHMNREHAGRFVYIAE